MIKVLPMLLLLSACGSLEMNPACLFFCKAETHGPVQIGPLTNTTASFPARGEASYDFSGSSY